MKQYFVKETVMCEGMEIFANRKGERLHIKADSMMSRTYTINDINVSVSLIPRLSRWYGGFGLYRPNGVDNLHLVIEEGVQHFSSSDEALEWLDWQNDRLGYMYTSSGLILGWKYQVKDERQKALTIEVWKFFVNGVELKNMSGANNEHLFIVDPGEPCQAQLEESFTPSKSKTIDGRLYSGKVIDLMYERDILPSKVEQAIKDGEAQSRDSHTFFFYNDSEAGFFWVKVDRSGRVVLIG
ncbi:MAG: hypothetical protein GY829_04390 [Gammaproteobacteria bacterium]|nr:hypothetical protein [Gammaproteobacteria bacterium]